MPSLQKNLHDVWRQEKILQWRLRQTSKQKKMKAAVECGSPWEIRTLVNGSKGHYAWPLHQRAAAMRCACSFVVRVLCVLISVFGLPVVLWFGFSYAWGFWVVGPWVGIAFLSFSMLAMMKSGSDDSIVKLSIVPQVLMFAVILLSGIFFHLLNRVICSMESVDGGI